MENASRAHMECCTARPSNMQANDQDPASMPNKPSPASAPSPIKCKTTFLDLPPEMRNTIYAHYRPAIAVDLRAPPLLNAAVQDNIASVCPQIAREFEYWRLSRTRFMLDFRATSSVYGASDRAHGVSNADAIWRRFLDGLEDRQVGMVKRLMFYVSLGAVKIDLPDEDVSELVVAIRWTRSIHRHGLLSGREIRENLYARLVGGVRAIVEARAGAGFALGRGDLDGIKGVVGECKYLHHWAEYF